MQPLSIISYPKKGIRNIRINAYTLICIDYNVFNDIWYSMYRSGENRIILKDIKALELICSFLSIDVKSSYTNCLIIDNGICNFK